MLPLASQPALGPLLQNAESGVTSRSRTVGHKQPDLARHRTPGDSVASGEVWDAARSKTCRISGRHAGVPLDAPLRTSAGMQLERVVSSPCLDSWTCVPAHGQPEPCWTLRFDGKHSTAVCTLHGPHSSANAFVLPTVFDLLFCFFF
jgi:hypothetical protein